MDQAGLNTGDIIIWIGNDQLKEELQFLNILFDYQPVDTIEIEAMRNGKCVVQEGTFIGKNKRISIKIVCWKIPTGFFI